MDTLWRSVRYAVRTLRRTRGFTAIAVITFALAAGANAAMFSVVYGVLWRPLPYPDATHLVLVQRQQDLAGTHRPVPAPFFFQDDIETWQRLPSFESSALYSNEVVEFVTPDGPEVLDSATVSPSFFRTIDGPFAAGRALGPADDTTTSVVISERLARRFFATPNDAVGKRLTLSSKPYRVIGVASASFQIPSARTDVWMPAGFARTLNPRCCGFGLLARLRPTAPLTAARAEAEALVKSSRSRSGPEMHVSVDRLRDELVANSRPALLMLWSAAALLLLIACANVITLLLTREVGRARETAIRRALGASRAQLAQQSLIEAAVLATCGGIVGTGIAAIAVRVLKVWSPRGLPRPDAIHLDLPILLFSTAVIAITVLVTGLLPVTHVRDAAPVLRSGGEVATAAPRSRRTANLLCASELALSIVLLVGALLLGRSLVRLLSSDLGVRRDGVVTASLNLGFGGRPTDANVIQRVEGVIQRMKALPDVQTAGAGTSLPPASSRIRLTLRRSSDNVDYQATGVAVTPDFFHALGVRLLRGRLFTAADDVDHPPVMIMSTATARRFFGDRDPIGQTMTLPVIRNGVASSETMTLVGVIDDIHYSGLGGVPDDAVYRPFRQQAWVAPFLVVRTSGDPDALAATLRREIATADRTIVVSQVRTLDSIVSDAASPQRFRAELLGAIAGLALALAVVGLYGVVSYSVSQRRRDIAIRMALGATRRDVLGMILQEGLLVASVGAGAGLLAAAAVTRTISALLYGVQPTDPASFVAATAILLVVAFVATSIPARAATRVQPVAALRAD